MGHWEKKKADDDTAVPAEVKSAIAKLMRDFEAFKSKNDEELAEVKKKGSADVVVRDQVRRISDGLDDVKSEINTIFKKLQRPVSTGDAKLDAIEAKATREFAAWSPTIGDESKAASARSQYKAAFERMTRRGDKALSENEAKALVAGSAPDGGYYIEPARADFILQRLRETSAMRSIASAVTITSNSFKIPVDRDDVGYEWVSEQGTRSVTSTPQVGEIEIPVHEVSAMPKASQNMLDDAGIDVESWLNGKVSDRFARAENSAFVSGNGTSKPKGFLTYSTATTADSSRSYGVLQYKATGSSGAFKTASATVSPADDLLDLIYQFNAAYRSSLTWAMNRSTLGAIRKFKDQQGNYIYDPRLSANGITDTVLGYAVQEFADMPDYTTANAYAIALGDFRRGYQIVDRQGLRQLRDAFTSKPFVLFYTTKRVGGGVVDSDAIKLLKFGTS